MSCLFQDLASPTHPANTLAEAFTDVKGYGLCWYLGAKGAGNQYVRSEPKNFSEYYVRVPAEVLTPLGCEVNLLDLDAPVLRLGKEKTPHG